LSPIALTKDFHRRFYFVRNNLRASVPNVIHAVRWSTRQTDLKLRNWPRLQRINRKKRQNMKFTKFGVAFVLATFATLTIHAASAAGTSVFLAYSSPNVPVAPPAVPEPSTIFSGALLLIPLGAGMLRAYYKNRGK
jgi:hypothetical protein